MVSFWHDAWLDLGGPISHFFPPSDTDVTWDWTVDKFTTESGSWNSNLLTTLPMQIPLLIAATPPPQPNGRRDRLVWGGNLSGLFSIKSAYTILRTEETGIETLLKTILKWQGGHKE